MAMSSRKEKVLRAVVDSYIVGCEPVSSAEIREKHLPEFSSATIRNELAALEEMGFLAQPHTSAGRIPTADAYRLYVDKLMPKKKLTKAELGIINNYFGQKMTEIDDVLKKTAKVISEITNLTAVASLSDIKNAVVESVKIIKLNETLGLVVIVTTNGIIKDSTVELIGSSDDAYYAAASKFVTDVYQGHMIKEITDSDDLIKNIEYQYEQLFKAIIMIIKRYASQGMADHIVIDGGAKLLSQPEYASVDKARAMMEVLEVKEKLLPAMKSSEKLGINIKIAKDNELNEGSPEFAVVSANYVINGVEIGNAGVIGPMRMDYSKVVSVLDYIGKTIQEIPADKDKNKTD